MRSQKQRGHSESSTRKREREKKKENILKENVEEPITHMLASYCGRDLDSTQLELYQQNTELG